MSRDYQTEKVTRRVLEKRSNSLSDAIYAREHDIRFRTGSHNPPRQRNGHFDPNYGYCSAGGSGPEGCGSKKNATSCLLMNLKMFCLMKMALLN